MEHLPPLPPSHWPQGKGENCTKMVVTETCLMCLLWRVFMHGHFRRQSRKHVGMRWRHTPKYFQNNVFLYLHSPYKHPTILPSSLFPYISLSPLPCGAIGPPCFCPGWWFLRVSLGGQASLPVPGGNLSGRSETITPTGHGEAPEPQGRLL